MPVLFVVITAVLASLSLVSGGAVCGRDVNPHLKALLIQEEAVMNSFSMLVPSSELTSLQSHTTTVDVMTFLKTSDKTTAINDLILAITNIIHLVTSGDSPLRTQSYGNMSVFSHVVYAFKAPLKIISPCYDPASTTPTADAFGDPSLALRLVRDNLITARIILSGLLTDAYMTSVCA